MRKSELNFFSVVILFCLYLLRALSPLFLLTFLRNFYIGSQSIVSKSLSLFSVSFHSILLLFHGFRILPTLNIYRILFVQVPVFSVWVLPCLFVFLLCEILEFLKSKILLISVEHWMASGNSIGGDLIYFSFIEKVAFHWGLS